MAHRFTPACFMSRSINARTAAAAQVCMSVLSMSDVVRGHRARSELLKAQV